jgi:chromosome segregation ATPase
MKFFTELSSFITTGWEQRLQEEKDRASELSEWRIGKLEDAFNERCLKRKRQRVDSGTSETSQDKADEKMAAEITSKSKEIEQQQEQISAMKGLYNSVLEEANKTQEDLTKVSLELANQKIKAAEIQTKLVSTQTELATSNTALKAQNAEPKIAELETNVARLETMSEGYQAQITDLKGLLDEAGEDYIEKDAEIAKKDTAIANFKVFLLSRVFNIFDIALCYLDVYLIKLDKNRFQEKSTTTVH